jgi:O-antigen/teichoic acid export membrane protein
MGQLDLPASRRQAILGVFWSAVERAATQGISFIVVLLLARILGPENYGLVTLAATIALLGQMLLGETFSQALIQQKTLEPAHIASLFWTLLGAGVFAAASQVLLAGWFAAFFAQPALAPIVRALAPLLVLSALQAVPMAMFKRALDFRALAAASATGTLLGGVTGVSLAYAGFGPWSLVANLLVQNACTTIAIWRQAQFRPPVLFSLRHLRELWSYGQYTFLVRIAAFAANQSPRLLIGYLFGPAALGAFSLGLRVVEILYQLLSLPAVNVTVPVIAKIREDSNRLARTVLTATQLAAMISAPVFVALALIAPLLVPFAFGAKWTPSIPVIQILCVYGIVGSCALIWGGIIAGLGRPDVTLATTTTAALVSVSVLLLAAPWGLTAASVAFVARGYLTLPFMPLIIARLTGIPAARQYRVFLPIAIAVATMAVCVESVIVALSGVSSPLATIAAASAVAALSYGIALYVVARPVLQLGLSFLAQLRPSKEAA